MQYQKVTFLVFIIREKDNNIIKDRSIRMTNQTGFQSSEQFKFFFGKINW